MLDNTVSTLGEGPVWLADEGVYYWVDIMGKQIRFFNPQTGVERQIATPQWIGAAVPAGKGRLVCAMGNGLYMLDLASESFQEIAVPESHLPGNRFNDGKCDPAGRFWAGTMSLTSEPGVGSLYCLERDGSVRRVLENISISNGLGWSPDNRWMYYIDTPTCEIWRFQYDLASGQISGKQTIVTVPDGQGTPDGMAVDAEGMIWVALWGGYGVARYNPDTGEQLEFIRLPVSQVTSCCFGGEHLDELFITSANIGLSEEELKAQPLAGSCFRIKPGVSGLPVAAYQPAEEA